MGATFTAQPPVGRPAMTQVGGHHPARRQRGDHFQTGCPEQRAPRTSARRGITRQRSEAVEDPERGPEGRMDPHSAFRSSARHCTQPKPSCRVGGTRSGAFRPPGYSAGTAECSVSYAVSALTIRKEDRTNQTACCGRGEQGTHYPDGGGTPDANQLAIGGNGVPADRLIERSRARAGPDVAPWATPRPGVPRLAAARVGGRGPARMPCAIGAMTSQARSSPATAPSLRASGRHQRKVVAEGPTCGSQAARLGAGTQRDTGSGSFPRLAVQA